MRLRESLGSEVMAHVEVDARAAETAEMEELARDSGGSAQLRSGEGAAVLVGRFDAHSTARPEERVEIAVDTRSLHFFDPETGLGIYDHESTDEGGTT
jgi:multiple sugar transport system ATP-binding protein